MEKMTIAKQYDNIIAKVQGILSKEEIAFLEDRKAKHIAKNASKKMTKAQVENEEIKANILDAMEVGKAYTVTEIMKAVGLDSNQKTSALVRQLKESGLVVRSESKGKAYFTKA